MFKKIENKIKEIALRIHKQNSKDNNIYEDSKRLYELAVIYNFLSNSKKDSEWTGAFWILLTAALADVKKKPGILLSPLG